MSEYEDTCPDCLREAEKEVQPMSHTPGPWKWNKKGLVTSGNGKKGLGRFIVYAYKDQACCNAEDDARLIAAAPSLLAALSRMIECYEEQPQPDIAAGCLEAARTAIRHAEGRG